MPYQTRGHDLEAWLAKKGVGNVQHVNVQRDVATVFVGASADDACRLIELTGMEFNRRKLDAHYPQYDQMKNFAEGEDRHGEEKSRGFVRGGGGGGVERARKQPPRQEEEPSPIWNRAKKSGEAKN